MLKPDAPAVRRPPLCGGDISFGTKSEDQSESSMSHGADGRGRIPKRSP